MFFLAKQSSHMRSFSSSTLPVDNFKLQQQRHSVDGGGFRGSREIRPWLYFIRVELLKSPTLLAASGIKDKWLHYTTQFTVHFGEYLSATKPQLLDLRL